MKSWHWVWFLLGWMGLVLAATGTPGSPVTLTLEKHHWPSSTHLHLSLIVHLQKGWKIYGPAESKDTLVHPTMLTWKGSTNINGVSVTWPKAILWQGIGQEAGQQAHVYYDQVTIPLDIFLAARGPSQLHLQIKGLSCATVCQPFMIEKVLALTPPSETTRGWLTMFLFAFLGGIILNVMPCVLPVLGMKLKTLTQTSGMFRKVCLVTTGGCLVGFWLLALATVILKNIFQQQVGWGMQLQNPYFLVIMAFVMLVSAYGLLGMFHLQTPYWAVQAATSSSRSVLWKSFFSGLFSVLLATPCSAPFLGPAVGFALTGTAIEIFCFYTAIALGFSLPYLLGMLLPISRFLPKPGPWMVGVERVMGVLFFLSAAWLLGWPFSAFLSPLFQQITWIILGILALIPCFRSLQWSRRHTRLQGMLFHGLPLGLASSFLFFPKTDTHSSGISMQDGKIHWMAFDTQKLEASLQAGRIVFIDVTGAGCLTCMVNKRLFMTPEVQKLFTHPEVLCMRGDYSRGEPSILAFLQRYQRSAIPFNLVLSREHPKGILLSELLSLREIQGAMDIIRSVRKKALTPSKKSS